MNEQTEKLTRSLAAQLIQRGQKICTAESCTGGLIAKSMTDLAGSSSWFERGFVTYSNEAKMELLQVDPATLQAHGAVSEAVAREMVSGALHNSHAEVAIAVTGIAGPDGGTADKPVGTVWFGFAAANRLVSEKQLFGGDRQQVREASMRFALQRIVALLKD